MKILITGSQGFLSKNLSKKLINLDIYVMELEEENGKIIHIKSGVIIKT